MTKLQKLIKVTQLIIKKPYLLNHILNDDKEDQQKLVSNNPEYKNGLPTIEIIQLFPNFKETINPYSFLDGGSLVTDIALLKGLAKQKQNCIYFEIGTWRGESVTNVASVAEKCYTLNLSNEDLKEMGFQQKYLNQQGFYSNGLDNVTHLKGNSATFDFSPYYGKCDIVFVDGDHAYEAVKRDTEIAFKLLKDENSIIVWHDYAYNPETVRWDVFRGILEGSPKDKTKHLKHVSNTMCAIYNTKQFGVIEKSNLITPTKKFEVTIEAKTIEVS